MSRGCLLLHGTWSYLRFCRRSVLPYTRFCICFLDCDYVWHNVNFAFLYWSILKSTYLIYKEVIFLNKLLVTGVIKCNYVYMYPLARLQYEIFCMIPIWNFHQKDSNARNIHYLNVACFYQNCSSTKGGICDVSVMSVRQLNHPILYSLLIKVRMNCSVLLPLPSPLLFTF